MTNFKGFIVKRLEDIEYSLSEVREEDFDLECEYEDYRLNLFGMRQAYEEMLREINNPSGVTNE